MISHQLRQRLTADLETRRQQQRYRQPRSLERQGVWVRMEGHELLAFCGNDYLSLSQHPQVCVAAKQAIDRHGVGSGAAHLISGHSTVHQALEEELAAFCGCERALLFSTGYMANLALMATFAGRSDHLFEDRLNHASLIDGGLASTAQMRRYPHLEMPALRRFLQEADGGQRLVATDAVFSMDGDLAPLPELLEICSLEQALLVVDDAHGFGVLGPGGRGTPAHFGLAYADLDLYMATLGKGLGVFGAFVAGSQLLVEHLIQQARPYIYTTATPPALAEATRAALKLVAGADAERDHLHQLVARFRHGAEQLGLSLLSSQTPIQPILLGSESRALAWSRALKERGLWVSAIRPPTVPEGSSRLRLTFCVEHQPEQVDQLLEALGEIAAGENQ